MASNTKLGVFKLAVLGGTFSLEWGWTIWRASWLQVGGLGSHFGSKLGGVGSHFGSKTGVLALSAPFFANLLTGLQMGQDD